MFKVAALWKSFFLLRPARNILVHVPLFQRESFLQCVETLVFFLFVCFYPTEYILSLCPTIVALCLDDGCPVSMILKHYLFCMEESKSQWFCRTISVFARSSRPRTWGFLKFGELWLVWDRLVEDMWAAFSLSLIIPHLKPLGADGTGDVQSLRLSRTRLSNFSVFPRAT